MTACSRIEINPTIPVTDCSSCGHGGGIDVKRGLSYENKVIHENETQHGYEAIHENETDVTYHDVMDDITSEEHHAAGCRD